MRAYIFTALFTLLSVISFAQEDIVSKEEALEREKPSALKVFDELPVFPGCEGLPHNELLACFQSKLVEHIKKTFHYPDEALKEKIEGTVIVSFVIGSDGFVEKLHAKGHDLLTPEGIRIIKLLPRIEPAKYKGTAITFGFSIPINFKI